MVRTSRPPRISPDDVIGGRYAILAELGHGGMSVVYRAHDRLLNCEVALKLLKQVDDEPRNLLFLQQEFRAMARLRHPGLVQVFDYGMLDDGSPYFTMELLKGEDLSSVGQLSLDSILSVLVSIADVLSFMHARGYVHRDVKPSNVRIVSNDPSKPIEVKLMDFGLTEQLGRQGLNAVAGTLAYLAPEAWLGAPADVRADLYALGVLAYEITAGRLPFDVSTGARLLRTKTEYCRDLREIRADVSPEFACLLRDLLAPEPTNRPASASAVLARLCEIANLDFQSDSTVYLRAPALVGRSRELHAVRTSIIDSCSGVLKPTIIEGLPGVGKTRLLEEALIEIGVRGAVIVRATGRGLAGGSYEVLRHLLTPLLHLPTAGAVLARVGGKSALGLTRTSAADGDCEPNIDPTTANRALHLALGTFLDGIAKRRMIVLAIDDIHLTDAATLDALTSVVRAGNGSNLAIVATLRTSEPISASLSHLLALSDRLELGRINREQITELISGSLGPASPSEALVADLERASSGNVYFVLEILRDLAARGIIERRRTRVALPESLDGEALPTSLAQALERRISHVTESALTLARIVAVLERPIELAFARDLLGRSDEEFLAALDELRNAELIDQDNRQIRIHHPRLREVLHRAMDATERQTLHRRVAEAIGRSPEHDEVDNTAELGMHYAEAGDDRLALKYLVMAGDGDYQRYAYADARNTYQRAFGLVHAAPFWKRKELERKLNDRLGRICFYHDHGNGPKYLERARRYHLRHGILWAIGPFSRVVGSRAAVLCCALVSVLLYAARMRPRPVRATMTRLIDSFAATAYLANCYTYSGRLQLALDAAEQILPFVTSRQRLPFVAYLMARAYALNLTNRFDEAAAACEESLRILKSDRMTPIPEHDRVHATGGALVTRLWVDLTRGYSDTSDWWAPFEQHCCEHPTALLESWLMEVRVFAAYRQGQVVDTEAAWSQFLRKAAQAEVAFVQNKARVWVGLAYVDAGRMSEAQDTADEVIRAGQSLDHPMLLAHGLHLRGLVMHAWERLDDARACFEEAETIAKNPDVSYRELHHSILLSRAALALDCDQFEEAVELATYVKAENAPLQLKHDLHCARAECIMGQVAMAKAEVAVALRHLQESWRIASATDDRIACAQSLHYLAKALAANAELEAAHQHRAECVEMFRQLGNTYQLRRLGYTLTDNPEMVGDESVLSRVVQLVSASNPRNDTGGLGSKSSSHKCDTEQYLSRLALATVRDETLVTSDTGQSVPSS